MNRSFAHGYTGRRAFAHFLAGDYSAAEADFIAAIELGDARPYIPLWRHLSAEKSGADNLAILRAYDDYDPNDWPGPVIELFLGNLSADQVLARADDRDPIAARQKRTEALFYIGQYYLLENKRPEATQAFKELLELGDRFFVEYRGALVELERLGAL